MIGKQGYIYALIDPTTDLVRYVGQTINYPSKRYAQHIHNWKRTKGRLRHVDSWLKHLSTNKLEPILDILEICNVEDLDNKEINYIRLYKSVGARLCNHSEGGCGNRGHKMSEESIKKRSETCSNSILWKQKCINHSEIMKEKHRNGFVFGYSNLSKERRAEIGKNHSLKLKERYKNNPDAAYNLINSRNIPVDMIDCNGNIIQTFKSASEAARELGMCTSTNITKVCKGKTKNNKTLGYMFKYSVTE